MNRVVLVGTISDRPFRPGCGQRVVFKVTVKDDRAGRSDQIEVDAFAALGDRAMTLWVGDIVSVDARLEDRRYKQDGEEVAETRCVADAIELLVQGRDTMRSTR